MKEFRCDLKLSAIIFLVQWRIASETSLQSNAFNRCDAAKRTLSVVATPVLLSLLWQLLTLNKNTPDCLVADETRRAAWQSDATKLYSLTHSLIVTAACRFEFAQRTTYSCSKTQPWLTPQWNFDSRRRRKFAYKNLESWKRGWSAFRVAT